MLVKTLSSKHLCVRCMFWRWQLCRRVLSQAVLDLGASERALVQQRIGDSFQCRLGRPQRSLRGKADRVSVPCTHQDAPAAAPQVLARMQMCVQTLKGRLQQGACGQENGIGPS